MHKRWVVVKQTFQSWQSLVGLSLILGGGVALLGQVIRSDLVMASSFLAASLVLIGGGQFLKMPGLLIAGWITAGFWFGLFLTIIPVPIETFWEGAVRVCAGIGLGFLSISLSIPKVTRRESWWALFPAVILLSSGIGLILQPISWWRLTLLTSVSLGALFIFLGMKKKWLGFIIPGSLLSFAGIGVSVPWGWNSPGNVLTKTGTMLVCFAFGWLIITLFSRLVWRKTIWWPLIPGGVLAVVGWALFISGDPSRALEFIGNTSSVTLMILGIYLLLLRRSIQKKQ